MWVSQQDETQVLQQCAIMQSIHFCLAVPIHTMFDLFRMQPKYADVQFTNGMEQNCMASGE